MTRKTKATNGSTAKADRQALLERMWEAQTLALVAILENTPADQLTAATLNVVRQYLADNGTRVDTIGDKTRAADHMASIAAGLKDVLADEEPLPPPAGHK